MARPYVITTDSTCDFPRGLYETLGLGRPINIDYIIDDVTYDGETNSLNDQEFYGLLADGKMPITQQGNPQRAIDRFRPALESGADVLHLAFSSGLSGTYNSMCMAARELEDQFPEAKIIVLDTLCASMGEGLLVYKAVQLKNQGKTLEEVAAWVEENKLRVFHDVVADDLFHLHRGGRVSKASAVMGSALGIKPRIHVNDEGKLINYAKARGKKTALTQMADRLAGSIKGHEEENDIIFISHSHCLEDAEILRDMIKERTGIDNFMISYIGPTIGTHTGIGTVALFYMAGSRAV